MTTGEPDSDVSVIHQRGRLTILQLIALTVAAALGLGMQNAMSDLHLAWAPASQIQGVTFLLSARSLLIMVGGLFWVFPGLPIYLVCRSRKVRRDVHQRLPGRTDSRAFKVNQRKVTANGCEAATIQNGTKATQRRTTTTRCVVVFLLAYPLVVGFEHFTRTPNDAILLGVNYAFQLSVALVLWWINVLRRAGLRSAGVDPDGDSNR